MSKKTSLGRLPVGGAEPLIAAAVCGATCRSFPVAQLSSPRPSGDECDNFDEQARFVPDMIVDVLRSSGSSPEEMLRVECYLARREDVPAWNEFFAEYVPPPLPAWTTVEADFGVEGLLIEIQVTAGVPDGAA
jgi:enamine deaminase RidA (YjgF/YER057c/UK114 family)